jgi:hypothetical protein
VTNYQVMLSASILATQMMITFTALLQRHPLNHPL